MKLEPQALSDFTAHVIQEHPREACGFIVDGNYIPVPNSSQTPLVSFRVDPIHYIKTAALGEIQALLHSHPYLPGTHSQWPMEWPSTGDMETWLKGTIPWGICASDGEGITQLVWLDEEHPEPLIGREFVHGINDCFSIIRDWYKINRSTVIPNYARGMDWWFSGKNLYEDNFEKAGFVEIDRSDIQIGDVVLIRVAAPVVNHAAIVTGENEITHHLHKRLSGVDSLAKWNKTIVRAVRFKGPQC